MATNDAAPRNPKRAMIVTGASSGIGRELALAAARAGFAVVISARRAERLAEVSAQIAREGGDSATVVADARDAATPSRLVSTAMERFGRIDVVAPFAGSGAPGALLDQSDEAIDAQIQTHVIAPLRLARTALPHLRAVKGQILLIGSGLARIPAPGYGAYAPAKAAIRAAAAQLRRELKDDGVAVTYVDPGAVDTEFSQASGMERRASPNALADADVVAQRILRAVTTRARRINAVPWQTSIVVSGEWFPGLADRVLARIVDRPKRLKPPAPPAPNVPESPVAAASHAHHAATDFERALEPVARRMERVNLPSSFVASLLEPGTTVSLHDAAMRWAGMPNKNERAAMHEVLDALASAGYLRANGSESWVVERSADERPAAQPPNADGDEEQ